MLILFELDPNVVRPGWTPLLITVGLGVVMYLLFRSMRRQFRRVHDNFPTDDGPAGAEPEAATGPVEPAAVTAAEDVQPAGTATAEGARAQRP